MRPHILSVARACLIGVLASSLINLPLMAASAKPLGMIVIADRAKVDHADAAVGADLYSGDALATQIGGSLRMRLGPSQVYLLSDTQATLVPREKFVEAKLGSGTIGFSSGASSQFAVGTPLGTVQGIDGKSVFAQVAVLSPAKVQISAYEGSLLVTGANGSTRTINEGESYEATLAAPEPIGGPNQYGVGSDGWNWRHIAFVAAAAGTLAVVSYVLWHVETESCIKPPIYRDGHRVCHEDR